MLYNILLNRYWYATIRRIQKFT